MTAALNPKTPGPLSDPNADAGDQEAVMDHDEDRIELLTPVGAARSLARSLARILTHVADLEEL